MVFCLLTCKNIYFVFCLFMLFPFNSTHRLTHDQVWYGNDDSFTWFYSFKICFHENYFASVRKIICIKKKIDRQLGKVYCHTHRPLQSRRCDWEKRKGLQTECPNVTGVSGGLAQTLWRTCLKKSCCFLHLGISSIFGVNLKMSVYCSEGFPCDTHFISSPECAMLHASFKDFYWREVCPCTLPSF